MAHLNPVKGKLSNAKVQTERVGWDKNMHGKFWHHTKNQTTCYRSSYLIMTFVLMIDFPASSIK